MPVLLRDNSGFRRLWAAQTVALFGDQVSLVAFPLVAVIALAQPVQNLARRIPTYSP